MFGFHHSKKPVVKDFDREHLKPVLRCSICTGEQTAGFQDRRTGKFQEIQLIRDQEDLQEFMDTYQIKEIGKIY